MYKVQTTVKDLNPKDLFTYLLEIIVQTVTVHMKNNL